MLAYTEDILDYQGIMKFLEHNNNNNNTVMESKQGKEINHTFICAGCATSVLVTSAGMGEMVMQVLVGSVSLINAFIIIEKESVQM